MWRAALFGCLMMARERLYTYLPSLYPSSLPMAESLRADNALHRFIQLVSCSPRTPMGSLWLLEYRPAVFPAPAGPFRSLEHSDAKSSDRLRSSSGRHWDSARCCVSKRDFECIDTFSCSQWDGCVLTPLRMAKRS